MMVPGWTPRVYSSVLPPGKWYNYILLRRFSLQPRSCVERPEVALTQALLKRRCQKPLVWERHRILAGNKRSGKTAITER